MANKTNQRARALQASTGVSFQAAKNELKQRSDETSSQKDQVFTQHQLYEAIALLPPRLPADGERISTEVTSITHVNTKVDGPESPIQLAPIDLIVWDVTRECFRTTLNLDVEQFEIDAHGGVSGFQTWLSVMVGGRAVVHDYAAERNLARVTVKIGRVRHRGDPSKVHVLHSFVWPTNPFLTFSEQCPSCKRWVHCLSETDGVCECGAEFTIRFDREDEDWTMKQDACCMDCGYKFGMSEPKEGRNPWHPKSMHQTQCNRCHLAVRGQATRGPVA